MHPNLQSIPARVHILLASRANVAVIIVRRRSRLFHIVKWNLDNDHLEHGSWFKGRIYWRRSDLSPNGKYMVYFAMGPATEIFSWTAVCQPPWLKADYLWEKGDAWDGGGVFLDNRRLWLNFHNEEKQRISNGPLEKFFDLSFSPSWSEDIPIYKVRMEKNGWVDKSTKERTRFEKSNSSSTASLITTLDLRAYRKSAGEEIYTFKYLFKVKSGNPKIPEIVDQKVRWADWDHQDRLIIVKDGIIQRFTDKDLIAGTPSFTIDCNQMHPPAERGQERHSR